MQGDITRSAALVLFPPTARVWAHYGITAHPHGDITRSAALVLFPPTARAYGSITASRRTHSSTVQNRSGTPFRYAAVHENLTGSQESRVARAYVHILRIYQRLYKNREKLDHSMRAFLCAIAHSNVGWRSPVISSLAACVSVTLCGVPVQRGADPFGRFPCDSPPLLVPSPLSLIRRPPRPRPGRIHVRAPRPRAAPVLNYPP